MHVWMLTGDNGYTARTVGMNCGILSDMQVLTIDSQEIPSSRPVGPYQLIINGAFVGN
jgi:magnesium-transporting ATPase (P-type)